MLSLSTLLELNKKIQHFHQVDEVLLAVDNSLKEKMGSLKTIFLLNTAFNSRLVDKESALKNGGLLTVWGKKQRDYKLFIEGFELDVNARENIQYIKGENTSLKAVFKETATNLMIPIVQEDKLLCVIFIKSSYEGLGKDSFEFKTLEFMKDQLSIVLDRVLMYDNLKQKTAMDHAEKMQVMQSLSTSIAHEMRTPLSGIRSSISGVEAYLEDLISVYDYALVYNTEHISKIREDHLKIIRKTPTRIKLMIDQANTVIDMLLMNLRENSLNRKQLNVCSASKSIEQAVDRYPFRSGERGKVSLNLSENFDFLGIESLFVYIIFNLMKNAIYSLHRVRGGNISITLVRGKEYNEIIFKDTGEGIRQEELNKIFDGFYTTKNDGTGVGLAYCKRTVDSFDGTISCQSEFGSYTSFRILLPTI